MNRFHNQNDFVQNYASSVLMFEFHLLHVSKILIAVKN